MRDFRRPFDARPFDAVMAFLFHVRNLAVAGAYTRARRHAVSPALRLAAAGLLGGAAGFLLLGRDYFTKRSWGPAISARLAGWRAARVARPLVVTAPPARRQDPWDGARPPR
jgi:hypothetical protein